MHALQILDGFQNDASDGPAVPVALHLLDELSLLRDLALTD